MVESQPRFHATPAHNPSVPCVAQPGPHTPGRDSSSLSHDLLLGRSDQVSHHLPADRGVGIEQRLDGLTAAAVRDSVADVRPQPAGLVYPGFGTETGYLCQTTTRSSG